MSQRLIVSPRAHHFCFISMVLCKYIIHRALRLVYHPTSSVLQRRYIWNESDPLTRISSVEPPATCGTEHTR